MTPEQIIQVVQVGGMSLFVVALLTGQAWAAPAVRLLERLLKESHEREAALGAALRENTATMRNELNEMRDEMKDLRADLKERGARTTR